MQQPGTLLEAKYEILGKIREGGMGTIYRVRHRLLDEIRVVKVMQPHVVADEEMKRRFLEEAKTATRLKHPNICAIFDFALGEDGTAYLVMEFIDGVNLVDLLKSRGCPGLPLTLEIAHQALLALAYLHRKGVIHRDIAPDNLMLTHDEEGRPLIKLIDLGIAKAADRAADLTATGVFLGKLKYASPEQYGSLPAGEKLDGRSDLYGLGIVLYELLTGVRPFPGDSAAELLRAHLFTPPLPFSESDPEGKVPPDLREAVLKALEKKREDRYASAEEFDREIVSLRHRHARAEELEGTMAILSAIPPAGPSSAGSVTPSAQDRLNRQFIGLTTPHPTPSGVTIAPTVVDDGARTAVAPKSVSPRAASGPQRAPAALPETRETELPPPPRRRRALPWIGLAALLAAALLLWRPWLSRRETPRTPPAATPAPAPASAAQPAPSVPPAASPITAAEPAAEPAARISPASAGEQARSRQLAESARAVAVRARQAAMRARAPELAAALFDVAARKEAEAQRLFADGDFHASRAAFTEAAADFEDATSWIRSHAGQRPRPAEKVAALPEPTARPAPTVRLEPTRVEAPLPSPRPARPPNPAPAEPERGALTEQDRIRAVLREYERAQNAFDLDLYTRVYPALVGERRQDQERAWKALKSQRVDLEIRQIDVKNSHAVVRAYQRLVATPQIGSELRDARPRVFSLEKRGDSWVITRID